MLNMKSATNTAPSFLLTAMAQKTLIEFASDKMLTRLLVKERAKFLRRNRSDKHSTLNKESDLNDLSTRKMLSRMMPPRTTWARPFRSKRKKLTEKAMGPRKIVEKTLMRTINRDEKSGKTFNYLNELHAFCDHIRKRLSEGQLRLESPHLIPTFKDKEKQDDGTWKVTCRPLSVYTKLEDKIILALASRYIAHYFDYYLHENILSYRPARDFHGKHYVTDFNDGMELIKNYRAKHDSEQIYAADCDIKKFFDIIPHQVVRDCFKHMLDGANLNEDGKGQIMRVLDAYLNSYNFYTHALKKSLDHPEVFAKVQRKLHDHEKKNTYLLGKVDISDEKYLQRGVSQGGALSLLVANIVLNDVDKAIVEKPDDNRLFIRYCDDMILLHTDYDECCRLMDCYSQSLKDHELIYHNFESVSESKYCQFEDDPAVATNKSFWKIKSHRPFLWGKGEGDSNYYIGFLGYEIRRDGFIRLRKSNIQRFDEKFKRLGFALRRYRKTHTEDEFLAYQKKVLDRAIKGLEDYKAFDTTHFEYHAQFKYLQKKRERIEKDLRSK